MIYAPVVIPTLNRYEHLRQCLESLSRCTWADQTEVYVALDYPPMDKWDKYAPGWEKNRDWLRSIGDFGFKKLHVIERTENYGTWLPGQKGNGKSLIHDEILPRYDRYIVTEDDNVFAPSFLEYMNKGLELFENDDKVQSIGGYRFIHPLLFDDNTFFRTSVDYCPWGVGFWVKKQSATRNLNYQWYRQQVTISKLLQVFRQYGWGGIYSWMAHLAKRPQPEHVIDNYTWTYLMLTGRQQIMPAQTLVINNGLDGSGSMSNAIGETWCDPALNPMNMSEHFEFIGTGYEHFEENKKIYVHYKYWCHPVVYMWKSIKKLIKVVLPNS